MVPLKKSFVTAVLYRVFTVVILVKSRFEACSRAVELPCPLVADGTWTCLFLQGGFSISVDWKG